MNPSSLPNRWSPLAQCAALALLLPALDSCQLADPNKVAEPAKESDDATRLYPNPVGVDLSPESQDINDAARLLAGLEAVPGQDIHKKWRSEDFWKNYHQGTQFIWNEFASKRGAKVREWASAELADLNSQPVVFQPFGGPDFVHAHLLFPEAETFVVCGKAPCLELPKLQETTADTMADLLFALRETQATLLDPAQQPAPATGSTDASRSAVPVLLALAVRTGHVVESIELMPEESPEPVVPASAASSDPQAASPVAHEHPVSACVLSLRCGDGRARRIFYFQQALTDDGLPEGSALLQFLSKQDKVVVVLNSTGYDLHKPGSSRLQQYLLSHAAAVVQDPSGLPIRVFDRTAWNLRCYGSYAAAPNEFRDYEQPDLVVAFKDEENRPDPLPFGRGKVGEESPAAMIVARPLLAANELPFDTNVVPLEPQLGSGAPISDARPLPPAPTLAAPAALDATIPPPESTIPAAGSPIAQH